MMPLGPRWDIKEILYQACVFLVEFSIIAFAVYVGAMLVLTIASGFKGGD